MNYIKATVIIFGILGMYVFMMNIAFGQGLWH